MFCINRVPVYATSLESIVVYPKPEVCLCNLMFWFDHRVPARNVKFACNLIWVNLYNFEVRWKYIFLLCFPRSSDFWKWEILTMSCFGKEHLSPNLKVTAGFPVVELFLPLQKFPFVFSSYASILPISPIVRNYFLAIEAYKHIISIWYSTLGKSSSLFSSQMACIVEWLLHLFHPCYMFYLGETCVCRYPLLSCYAILAQSAFAWDIDVASVDHKDVLFLFIKFANQSLPERLLTAKEWSIAMLFCKVNSYASLQYLWEVRPWYRFDSSFTCFTKSFSISSLKI